MPQILNLADFFLLFRHVDRHKCCLVRLSEVYHTKHPSLFTTRRPYTAETCLIYGENSFAVVGDFQYVYAMIIPDQNNERRMLRILNTVIAIIIWYKNSSGDEIANVIFYAVRPERTRIR